MSAPIKDRFRTFECSYRYKGKFWALRIKATSFEDAKARLSAISFATVDGVDPIDIPVYMGPLAKVLCWLRNLAPPNSSL